MSEANQIQSLKILVVDDDELMLDQVSLTLDKLGIDEVALMSNGADALAAVKNGGRFDVVFLDLNMPEMDGIEVMRKLAEYEYAGSVALFSAEDFRILKTAESLAGAHDLNILGTLSKPVTVNSVIDLFSRFNNHLPKQASKPVEKFTREQVLAAIEANQIQPYYQPKVRATDHKLVSAEVLARWIVPNGEIITPSAFIPVAEESGIIDRLTTALFEQAMTAFGQWLQSGLAFSLGFNISADNLDRVDFPEKLSNIASQYGVQPRQIELEVTESRLMENLTTCLDVLTRLRLKGFGLSIDDFGTGYSSMAQLNQVPFTELKIDRAFVQGARVDPAALAILEASVELAKKLDMTVVAEGVEDEFESEMVNRLGCDIIQGYFIARPMPAEDFERWARNHFKDN
ncbi:EAL domain-containing protein [Aliikangiella marina]|uniref:EAL domain-containing protein n=1 Tax=Aliikangiella marina TaxID=1712262 RepID=A0A545T7J0_9GAMM|nr:EAL domain-containing response regulator [Aliikangiella marina]TQV73181.1 EAL domain-containing protein [Aliikangiella marina]